MGVTVEHPLYFHGLGRSDKPIKPIVNRLDMPMGKKETALSDSDSFYQGKAGIPIPVSPNHMDRRGMVPRFSKGDGNVGSAIPGKNKGPYGILLFCPAQDQGQGLRVSMGV